MSSLQIFLLPSPLNASHPANKGVDPIYVYDPSPIGGTHFNRRTLAQKYGVPLEHERGPAGHGYAIPTSASKGKPVAWEDLKARIREFCAHAKKDRRHAYQVTRIGGGRCGAHLDERQIAEAFLADDPGNLHLPGTWERLRNPTSRRVTIVSPFETLAKEDMEAVSWLLSGSREVEIVVPGRPLQHSPAVQLAERDIYTARLLSSDAPGICGRATPLIEALVWYCDFAIILKPGEGHSMNEDEQKQADRLKALYRSVVENKIGFRSLIAGAGMRPQG